MVKTRATTHVDPPPRRRPVNLATPDPVLATFVVSIDIIDRARIEAVAQAVGVARGFSPEEIEKRVHVNGTVDIGECIKLLLEEAITALGTATGAQIGAIETYLEMPHAAT